MEGAEDGRKRAAESLGWLTESSVMPKQHKVITGVGVASMVELRAQLYRTQEEARTSVPARTKKRDKVPLLSQKNAGVDARAKRDKLELKAVKDGSASYAALEKKAELYDKLARGELSDEDEKYSVDFFGKRQVQDEPDKQECHSASSNIQQQTNGDETDDIPLISTPAAPVRMNSTMDCEEHMRFVREVHQEVNEERQKAKTIRQRRLEEETAKRERLRQAFLRKKLASHVAANSN